MAVNIHITIIELNALHTKRQNLFQELDAVIHLLMEAKHWGLRKSRDRKSGSAGMPRPISYAVFCLKKKNKEPGQSGQLQFQILASPFAANASAIPDRATVQVGRLSLLARQ